MRIRTHAADTAFKNRQVNVGLPNRVFVVIVFQAYFPPYLFFGSLALDRPEGYKVITEFAKYLQLLARVLLKDILQSQRVYVQHLQILNVRH